MVWTSTGLVTYLYGFGHNFSIDESGQLVISPFKIDAHEYEGKKVPSGFFQQKNAEHVSAVLFSSSGTLSKFNRMGYLAGFRATGQLMWRTGTCYRHDNNSAIPNSFFFDLEHDGVTETWAEGLSMFHNPRARHPVDPDMFPRIAHHFFEGGQIRSHIPEFHPYGSYTWNLLTTDEPLDAE